MTNDELKEIADAILEYAFIKPMDEIYMPLYFAQIGAQKKCAEIVLGMMK